jgi:glutaredoxin 3
MHDGSSRVLLYTKRWCIYCLAAKRLFRRLGVPYADLPVDRDPELRRRASAAAGGWPTVPMIFVGETFIGGYREARALHARGELTALVGTAERSGT